MKRALLILITVTLSAASLWAQQSSAADAHDVATIWPGIHFQIFQIQRIAGDRLLVGVEVYAKPDAPPGGTQIGVLHPIPQDADPRSIAEGDYRPTPLSFESAIMTEEATKQTYATVKPDPAGPSYIPGEILAVLHPNEGRMLSLQFPVPPPPQPGNGGNPAQQTVSILLPNAKGPINGIVLPPPTPPPSTP